MAERSNWPGARAITTVPDVIIITPPALPVPDTLRSSERSVFENREDLTPSSGLFCSELVAGLYQRLRLLPRYPPSNDYLPTDFATRLTGRVGPRTDEEGLGGGKGGEEVAGTQEGGHEVLCGHTGGHESADHGGRPAGAL
jgi:hypothetical protein